MSRLSIVHPAIQRGIVAIESREVEKAELRDDIREEVEADLMASIIAEPPGPLRRRRPLDLPARPASGLPEEF